MTRVMKDPCANMISLPEVFPLCTPSIDVKVDKLILKLGLVAISMNHLAFDVSDFTCILTSLQLPLVFIFYISFWPIVMTLFGKLTYLKMEFFYLLLEFYRNGVEFHCID